MISPQEQHNPPPSFEIEMNIKCSQVCLIVPMCSSLKAALSQCEDFKEPMKNEQKVNYSI